MVVWEFPGTKAGAPRHPQPDPGEASVTALERGNSVLSDYSLHSFASALNIWTGVGERKGPLQAKEKECTPLFPAGNTAQVVASSCAKGLVLGPQALR